MPSWSRYEPYDLCLQGRVFALSFNSSISASSTSWAQIKTGAKKVAIVHYDLVAISENMKFSVYETPTITDGLNAVTPVNVNRNYADTAVTLFYSNPTGVSGGTLLLVQTMASGANKVGGTSADSETWVLKPNTSYGLKLENLGNSTTEFVFNMGFYEV